MTPFLSRHRTALLCLVLTMATLALYWPMTRHDFVNVDDPRFISQNPHVQAGLTWAGVKWAFQTFDTENWQPLTWLSHMLDCQLYGLNPGGHHFTSLLLHVANTWLLFLWLNGLTQAPWRSALVAALFAWHPLHVESVAWACERKDVLSTFFWMLSLLAYTAYARKDRIRPAGRRAEWFALTLAFFACGLMSKPMVVTLPCVLLLLDFWPLNRFGLLAPPPAAAPPLLRTAIPLILEKVPFLLLTVAMSLATLHAQKLGGALSSLSGMPLATRGINALVNYAIYLEKTFWPTGLAYFYPYTYHWPAGLIVGSATLLAAVSIICGWQVRRRPYLLVGWLWFVGTLVPTVGLVHVGIQSRADRYMYIPSIGVFLIVVWGLAEAGQRRAWPKYILPGLSGLALGACLLTASIQLTYWQNSLALSEHAIAVTRDNFVAYESLGRALDALGHQPEAEACYAKSVAIEPGFPQSQYNLGLALRRDGRLADAAEHFAAAVRLVPNRYETHAALGATYLLMGTNRLNEAVAELSAALALEPDSVEAQRGLAVALAQQGQITNALPHFAEAVRRDPANPDLRFDLGLALLNTHQPAAATAQFAEELRLAPTDTRAHYRLAQALEQEGRPAEALDHYRAALQLTPDFPEARAAAARILAGHPEWNRPGCTR